jgi:hypothetical protein
MITIQMKCLEFRDVTNKAVVLGVRGVDADMQGVDWARSREGGQQLRGFGSVSHGLGRRLAMTPSENDMLILSIVALLHGRHVHRQTHPFYSTNNKDLDNAQPIARYTTSSSPICLCSGSSSAIGATV